LRIDAAKLDHHQIAALVLERTGYVDSLEHEPDGDVRVENLEEFVGALEQFVHEQPEATLAEYLEQISLATDADDGSVDDAITLMTVHSAKGLEFDRVILTGMEEGVFPHVRSLDNDPVALEEERRLAYVALTRARRYLALSYVQARFLWGNTHVNDPSSFLRALPEEAITRHGRATVRKRPPRPEPRKREPQWDDDIELDAEYAGSSALGRTDDSGWAGDVEYESDDSVQVYRGMQVRHPKFGVGSVVSWSGSGNNMKLTAKVAIGPKTIMARFCELL